MVISEDMMWIFPVLNILKVLVFIAILVLVAVVLIKARKKRRERTREAIHQLLNDDKNNNGNYR
ncbi:MAG: hypothetical protein II038_03430 [Lachnospiraceae bacterium]|nr:hypothetical protein [Lachnospiraceae bacterium]